MCVGQQGLLRCVSIDNNDGLLLFSSNDTRRIRPTNQVRLQILLLLLLRVRPTMRKKKKNCLILLLLLLLLFLTYDGYMNNNNNNKAGGGLRHPEGLYDDEDRTTDEGVLIRIKLKLL